MHVFIHEKILLIINMGIVSKISTPTNEKKYKIILDSCQYTWPKREMTIKIFDENPTLQTYTLKGLAYTTLASKPTL